MFLLLYIGAGTYNFQHRSTMSNLVPFPGSQNECRLGVLWNIIAYSLRIVLLNPKGSLPSIIWTWVVKPRVYYSNEYLSIKTDQTPIRLLISNQCDSLNILYEHTQNA